MPYIQKPSLGLAENLKKREMSVKPWGQGLMDILEEGGFCTTGSWGVTSGGPSVTLYVTILQFECTAS